MKRDLKVDAEAYHRAIDRAAFLARELERLGNELNVVACSGRPRLDVAWYERRVERIRVALSQKGA